MDIIKLFFIPNKLVWITSLTEQADTEDVPSSCYIDSSKLSISHSFFRFAISSSQPFMKEKRNFILEPA